MCLAGWTSWVKWLWMWWESCNRPKERVLVSYGAFSSFLYLFRFGCFAPPYPLFTLISLMGNLFSSTPPFESSTLSVSISSCWGFGCSMRSTISRSSFHFPILVWLNAMELVYIGHAAVCMSIPNHCHFPTWDSKALPPVAFPIAPHLFPYDQRVTPPDPMDLIVPLSCNTTVHTVIMWQIRFPVLFGWALLVHGIDIFRSDATIYSYSVLKSIPSANALLNPACFFIFDPNFVSFHPSSSELFFFFFFFLATRSI